MVSVIEEKAYFIHQTVKEFLLRKVGAQSPTREAWRQSLDLKEAHKVLAEACLRFPTSAEIWLNRTNFVNALLTLFCRDTEPDEYCQRPCFLYIVPSTGRTFLATGPRRDFGTFLNAASARGH